MASKQGRNPRTALLNATVDRILDAYFSASAEDPDGLIVVCVLDTSDPMARRLVELIGVEPEPVVVVAAEATSLMKELESYAPLPSNVRAGLRRVIAGELNVLAMAGAGCSLTTTKVSLAADGTVKFAPAMGGANAQT